MYEEENEVEKKSYKWLRTMIVIVVILAVLAAGMMWFGRTTTAGIKVHGQNSLAETCWKAMDTYLEECKAGGKTLPNGEYIVKGYTDNTKMTISPCELFPDGGTSYYWSCSKTYWAVKIRDGKAYEAWISKKGTISDSKMIPYVAAEQVSQYKKHWYSSGYDVIGYYRSEEKDSETKEATKPNWFAMP